MFPGSRLLSFALLALTVASGPTRAQMFAYEPDRRGPVQSLTGGVHAVDFSFDGSSQVPSRFDFSSASFAIRYARPGLDLSIAYGWGEEGQENRRLIEAILLGWSGFLLTPRAETRLYLPLVIQSGYRAVGKDLGTNTASELFNFTTLAVGTGLQMERRFGSAVQFDVRAFPMIGLALRSFEGFAGDTWLVDTAADLHLLRVFGRYGVTLGYGYRWQEWDVDATKFISQIPGDSFDYSGGQHMLRLGMNW